MKKLSNATGNAVSNDIEAVLHAYEAALNASDTDAVLTLYDRDGVFMAPNSPSTVGGSAIHEAYTAIFRAIAFDTELSVEEVVQVAPDWAFVRTNSNGHVTVKAINQQVPDANHELFILHKNHSGSWKIARYAFATTLPLRQ